MISGTQTNHPLGGSVSNGAKSATPVERATTRLKAAGLRITQPRLAILAALIKRNQPSSIEAIHREVGATTCDLVTVYRCVAAFEEIGLVRRAFFHDGTALYEINLGQPTRYHIVCKATNRVNELEEPVSQELRRAIENVQERLRAQGYGEVGHIVEFFGTSPQTAARASGPAVPLAS